MPMTSTIQRIKNARSIVRCLWSRRHEYGIRIALRFHLSSAKAAKHQAGSRVMM